MANPRHRLLQDRWEGGFVTSVWHLPTERPPEKSVVWIISAHSKRIWPQSFSIHAGTVEYSNNGEWRVGQGDETGLGWISWYPDIPIHCLQDDLFEVWAYSKDFQPAKDILIPPNANEPNHPTCP